MKLHAIPFVLVFSLAACAINEPSAVLIEKADVSVKYSPVVTQSNSSGDFSKTITLEQIMADPDWIGRAPESWYWGDDSKTVFYQQKRLGSPLRDLFSLNLSTQKHGEKASKVPLAQQHLVDDKNAVLNSLADKEVYSFKGNIFVKNLITNQVKQLTYSSENAQQAMFLTNGDVAYRVGNVFYRYDMDKGVVVELANLKTTDKPKVISEHTSYLAKEQHKLINYIALQQRNKKLAVAHQQSLVKHNGTIANNDFYFGKNNSIRQAVLSPSGDKVFVSVTENKSSRADTDIMPNYITDNGDIAIKKVRSRVANNRQYSEALFLVDLTLGKKMPLSYASLPHFDTDVLAKVKQENFSRVGKRYKSVNKPRNIHLLYMYSPVRWSTDGQNLALMLEAWDNKTRWLVTVDFVKNKLVSQHELHDDAWVNSYFNEFGWFNNAGKNHLYYLSEESGYSHLYYKELGRKAVQLTSGEFEVSNVKMTKDQQRFIFTANKKHPGIYEVYQVDLSKNLLALTELGGMNNYALSPDETTLLIEHSSVTMPPELYIKDLVKNTPPTKITHTVSQQFLAMPWVAPNVIAIKSTKQKNPIYSRVYLPKNYDISIKKNRAVMFSHGAGYLQNAHLGWSGYFREFMFHSMLVQQGYVVIDMDYRASKGYGRDWRTAIYRHMGKPEVEDMRDGVNWLVENAHVDRNRIGTYGGSYGGFLTLMSMFTAPDLFAAGSALRLVSDWAYYNHGYTANILNTPADDAIAYERSSPIYFAQGLEKPLLINAPMVDDNVFFEDTVRLVQRLIELEKQDFETAIYPVEPHGFVQPSSWLDEYRRIYKLFETRL